MSFTAIGITIIVEESLVFKDDEVKMNESFVGFKTEMRVRILFSVNILPNLIFTFLHFDSIKTTLSQEKHTSLKQVS